MTDKPEINITWVIIGVEPIIKEKIGEWIEDFIRKNGSLRNADAVINRLEGI